MLDKIGVHRSSLSLFNHIPYMFCFFFFLYSINYFILSWLLEQKKGNAQHMMIPHCFLKIMCIRCPQVQIKEKRNISVLGKPFKSSLFIYLFFLTKNNVWKWMRGEPCLKSCKQSFRGLMSVFCCLRCTLHNNVCFYD